MSVATTPRVSRGVGCGFLLLTIALGYAAFTRGGYVLDSLFWLCAMGTALSRFPRRPRDSRQRLDYA